MIMKITELKFKALLREVREAIDEGIEGLDPKNFKYTVNLHKIIDDWCGPKILSNEEKVQRFRLKELERRLKE
jgi:hypothetical protein